MITVDELELREFNSDDMEDLYKWRNHPIVRKNSFNTHIFSWDEHQKWFKQKRRSPNTTIYIFYSKSKKIGMIRFENEHKMISVSVMLNPKFIGQGLGVKLIRLGVKKFINKKKVKKGIVAEIKENNIAAQKAFQKSGFKINHLTYIFKQSKNENR